MLPGVGKRHWGRPPRPAANKDMHIACSKCAVTFIHTAAQQVTFKNKNFVPPKKCSACIKSTKAEKFVLFKAQLKLAKKNKKLAKKNKKQTLQAAQALATPSL
jgi:hypothetical protein